jgi:hypothetical protein
MRASQMKLPLRSTKRTFLYSAVFITLSILACYVFIVPKLQVQALDTSDFIDGRIIDDSVFYNKDAMNVDQIQAFLNKLIPNCDTWGTGKSEYGGGTRAQYAASSGWPAPPYVCLNNYYENPQTNETSFEKGGGAFDGGISAAQIIYNNAQQYGINPQVLLVMLKKESDGPLTSDSWPLKSQYKYAMGYNCPDSGPGGTANCDASQGGFYKQVTKAAWQLKYYKDHQNDYRYKLGINQIQYSPDLSCGTKTVNIENIATLSLYIYTPYTPNAASLANYPGSAPCGAYGNRNFFMYFKEWFGSPNYRPPTCDVRSTGTTCVWLLFDPNQRYEFLTTNDTERDTAVRSSKYSYDSIAFYAFTSQRPGTVPVYRIKLPNRHFYTSSESEKNSILTDQNNVYEGVAFYVYPSSTSESISYPIYRLNGSRGHILTASSTERDTLISEGYTNEGLAFNTPSGFISPPSPPTNRLNVYRLSTPQDHMYTQSLAEADNLVKKNWALEGVLQDAPVSPTPTPVYRLLNQSHVFTSSTEERDQLIQKGWKYEGIAWYTDTLSTPVYRFYTNNHHFYTSSLTEAFAITNRSATYEGIAYGKSQTNVIPIYRFFKPGDHFFTANVNEALSIANTGWTYEGIGWNTTSQGGPIYRLNGPSHLYTASPSERDELVKAGWIYEGIGWQSGGDNPIYRLSSLGGHMYTASRIERDSLIQQGWLYEGTAW